MNHAQCIPAPPTITSASNVAIQRKFDALHNLATAGDIAAIKAFKTNSMSQQTYVKKLHQYKLSLLTALGAGETLVLTSACPDETPGGLKEQGEAPATEDSALLRATLAEAHATIEMVEGALVPLPNYAEFFLACENGDADTVRSLLPKLDVNHSEPPGITGLHVAACNGHADVVTVLLENGAAKDPRLGVLNCAYGQKMAGATPLSLAYANRRTAAIQVLLSQSADPTASTDDGYTGKTLLPIIQRIVPGLQAIRFRVS